MIDYPAMAMSSCTLRFLHCRQLCSVSNKIIILHSHLRSHWEPIIFRKSYKAYFLTTLPAADRYSSSNCSANMGDFYRLELRRFPKIAKRETADSRYWKRLNFPIVVKEHGVVSHVEFCRSKPHDFAVTSSSRVQIYSCSTNQVAKSFSRFKDKVYCGSLRDDGQLLIAGGDDGLVQLFDVSSRAILRDFKGHKGAVHVTRFLSDNLHAVSAGDDSIVACWDIATEQKVTAFSEHQDYIRCGIISQANKDMFLTGSYDHSVKVWDMRSASSILSINHGFPVECVQLFPSGGICVSAGSNIIKVWDILAGGRLLAGFSNHQKTITSLCFDGEHKRLLSGSLDRHVKIYNIQDYAVVHSIDYPSPILSLAVSPGDSHLVVGMSTGLLSIKCRLKKDLEKPVKELKRPAAGTYRYFVRGKNFRPQESDLVITAPKKCNFKEHDKLLKSFEYSKALDSVLCQPKFVHAPLVTSLLQELIRRKGLKIALAGRDEESLVPVLRFLVSYISNPRYAVLLTEVANVMLDIYGPVLGQSRKVDGLFSELRKRINVEIRFHQKAFELLGSLDTLFAAASSSATPITRNDSQ